MNAKKEQRYWQQVAQNLENTRLLKRADIVIMTEGVEDEDFWTSVFNVAIPDKKLTYYYVSQNPSGRQCKDICLKYENCTSRHFVLCIDSDFDAILDSNFPDKPFIFHTITYSWENHYCWSKQLDPLLHGIATQCSFNFDTYIVNFSNLIYPFLVKLITAKHHGIQGWYLDDMCEAIDKVQFNQVHRLKNDGAEALAAISNELALWEGKIGKALDAKTINKGEQLLASHGIDYSNAYLYMQGHCVYDMLERIGRFLCHNTGFDFKSMVLKKNLAVGRYPEIRNLVSEIRTQYPNCNPVENNS